MGMSSHSLDDSREETSVLVNGTLHLGRSKGDNDVFAQMPIQSEYAAAHLHTKLGLILKIKDNQTRGNVSERLWLKNCWL